MPRKRTSRTEIIHIVVTGYRKMKDPIKHYVFVIDVTWNNNERFEVYRRYSDFFSFQTALKVLFPAAAGKVTNSQRVIPQLPKRIFVGRSNVAKVAEARLDQLNRYTQTLFSLDPYISESAHVVGFFSPRNLDKALPKLHLYQPASLYPSKIPLGNIFEEYCALAEYVAEDSSQISFKAGDKVLVMSKDESGWWMCAVDDQVGWAPPSYIKKCSEMNEGSDESEEESVADMKTKDSDDSSVEDNTASDVDSSITSTRGFFAPEIDVEEYKAIDSYQADGPGQVSFEEGDMIQVLDKLEDGWWFVSNGKEEGWAPCSYLEGDKDEESITDTDTKKGIEKYYAVDTYEAEEDDEISFRRGVVVDVLQKSLDGWWLINVDKQVGLAPATFLKKVESPDINPFPDVTQSLPATRTFQQPPRKQSVRAKASMRVRPLLGKSLLNKQGSSLPSIPDDSPTAPIPDNLQTPTTPVNPPIPPAPYNRPTPPNPYNRPTPPTLNNRPTPPVPDDRPAPPVPDNRPTPPVPDDRPTPPVPDNRPTPPVPDNRPTPLGPDDRPAPPVPDNRPTPPVPDDRPTPPVPDNRPTPPVPDNRPTPPVPDNRPTAPDPNNRPTALVPDNRPSPPVPNNRPFPPVPDNRPSPPVPDNRPFPPTPDNRPFPPIPDNRPSPPVPDNRPFPPIPDNRPTPPIPNNRPFPPIPDNRPSPPVPDNRPFPPIPDNRPTPPIPNNRPFPPGPINRPTPPGTDNLATPPTPDNQSTHPIPVQRASANPKLKSIDDPISSDLSDSDPENNYLNVTFDYVTDRPKRTSSMSGSISSFSSEDSSLRGGTAKRPVATPRSKSPQPPKKGRHTVISRSLLEGQSPTLSLTPTLSLPPRPKEFPAVASKSDLPLRKNSGGEANEPEPSRPKLRPSSSEIKRAKDRARAVKYNSSREGSLPSLKIVDEDPKRAGGKKKVKKTHSSDQSREAGGKRLSPGQPSRQRHRSEGPTRKDSSPVMPKKQSASSGAKASQEVDGMCLNQQIAGTLLRYIITSEDSSLKEALRDLITKDSNTVCSINEQ